MKKLVLGGSPHIKSKISTASIMIDVCIALIPAIVVGIVIFGLNALLIVALSVLTCVACEIIYKLLFKKSFKECMHEFDFTSVVTGLLIGMNMPVHVELYIPVIAGIFAIVIVKMIFGGTGNNLVNPAIAGRIFVFLSFGSMATGWLVPQLVDGSFNTVLLTGATPLTSMLTEGWTGMDGTMLMDAFLGFTAGCIGETSAAALLLGGLYLSIKKVINPILPVIYIIVTGLVTVMLFGFDFSYFLPSILTGGLMLGAIFMATDYTTTPNTFSANLIYFACLGIFTAILRKATGIEVVSFVILLMSITVPLFDKYIVLKPFGSAKAMPKEVK